MALHYTFEALVTGKPIERYYANARKLWTAILSRVEPTNALQIADEVDNEQLNFESECGGRYIGQEIMAVVGICQFYSTDSGFGECLIRARAVFDGIQRSNCSMEVKMHADAVARLYSDLTDDDEM